MQTDMHSCQLEVSTENGAMNMLVEAAQVSGTRPGAAISLVVLESFRRIIGRPLVPTWLDDDQAGRWLYEDAPHCVLAHDTAPDPRFIYANKAAQRCFEYPWAEFAALPSRLSAEEPNQADRQALLDKVARDGFAKGYRGLRVSRSGRRFPIEDVTMWKLIDGRGVLHGQGAMFPAPGNAQVGSVEVDKEHHAG